MPADINTSQRRIGETLMEEGFLEEKKVRVILLRQEYGDARLFGEIATSLKYISEKELTQCLGRT